ncbi:aldehyde dehydrogenase domain-containing protein [Dipodascopsis tothii]|uniref:aldehyde dehydrogenase domain-containing protein n=1 Tax=Dipodascopsis tothii TaxID=44089 RepID=UPI0034CD46C1
MDRLRASTPRTWLRQFHASAHRHVASQRLVLPGGAAFEQPVGLFINNDFVASTDGATLAVIDPATEREIAQVHCGGTADVNRAVAAAKTAFESWRSVSGADRRDLLLALSSKIEQHADVLAGIESWNCGKPLTAAREEDVADAINVSRYFAGWADKIYGRSIQTAPGRLAYTLHEPYGVCGQIVPWNYALMLAMWKLAPAIAAGNTVVLKPAEQTPLSLLYLAQLVRETGFPPGVVNVVPGTGAAAGASLAAHEDVRKVSFTGSTATGRTVMKAAAATVKSVTLELGGKSPAVVFADADLDLAVRWTHAGAMSNAGQICSATARVLVQRDVYDAFVSRFAAYTATESRSGPPASPQTTQGPQISAVQRDRVQAAIASGVRSGARLVHGGLDGSGPSAAAGFYVPATVFADVADDTELMREEIFGPVVALAPFDSEAEAVRRANATHYGLGAAVFTADVGRAHRIAREIEAGMVWINSSNDTDYQMPFGGFKASGFGPELGEYGLTTYTHPKTVYVNVAGT